MSHTVENGSCMLQECLSGWCEREWKRAAGPHDELYADDSLKASNLLADGGLTEAEQRCSAAKAAGIGDCDERSKKP